MTICQALRRLFSRTGKNYCNYGGSCLCSQSPLKDRYGNTAELYGLTHVELTQRLVWTKRQHLDKESHYELLVVLLAYHI